ncbi:hypothetical protein F4825DRAFT_475509 [Nemania diffusa]|nr:hypothetical protein F4825DRAFT_475509 [Nemania diffusa]
MVLESVEFQPKGFKSAREPLEEHLSPSSQGGVDLENTLSTSFQDLHTPPATNETEEPDTAPAPDQSEQHYSEPVPSSPIDIPGAVPRFRPLSQLEDGLLFTSGSRAPITLKQIQELEEIDNSDRAMGEAFRRLKQNMFRHAAFLGRNKENRNDTGPTRQRRRANEAYLGQALDSTSNEEAVMDSEDTASGNEDFAGVTRHLAVGNVNIIVGSGTTAVESEDTDLENEDTAVENEDTDVESEDTDLENEDAGGRSEDAGGRSEAAAVRDEAATFRREFAALRSQVAPFADDTDLEELEKEYGYPNYQVNVLKPYAHQYPHTTASIAYEEGKKTSAYKQGYKDGLVRLRRDKEYQIGYDAVMRAYGSSPETRPQAESQSQRRQPTRLPILRQDGTLVPHDELADEIRKMMDNLRIATPDSRSHPEDAKGKGKERRRNSFEVSEFVKDLAYELGYT